MRSVSWLEGRLFYGWVVVVVCLIIGTTIFGISYSFGVFFKSIEGEFDLTRAATSGIFSAYMVLSSVFTVLGGWALDKYGPRIVALLFGLFTVLSLSLTSQTNSLWQLFITYSLLLAIGMGPAYPVVMTTTSRWFDKRRGLALGIAGSGSGVGTVVMAPLASHLISNFDWRVAYIVMGLIAGLIIIPLSLLLEKDPGKIGVLPNGIKSESGETEMQKNKEDNARPVSLSLRQALRTRSFWFLGVVWLLFSWCLHLVVTHVVPHATDLHISVTDAAVILSLMGATFIPGRVTMGVASDRIGQRSSAIICVLLSALAMVWLICSKDLWMFYLFAVVFGFGWGGIDPPVIALMTDIFGLRSLGAIMGALAVGWSIGAAIGPAVGGFLFDASNSYFMAFLLGAIAMLLAAIFVALSRKEVADDTPRLKRIDLGR